MRAKIVQFKDGTYGVRDWFFGYRFLSCSGNHCFRSKQNVREFCHFNTLNSAQRAYDRKYIPDQGTPVQYLTSGVAMSEEA